MDLSERLARRVDEGAVAKILHGIATAANRRATPAPGDEPGAYDFWFDGGAARIQTRSIEYQFADGTRATVAAPVPALSVTIEFPNRSLVRVQQESWGVDTAG